MCFRAVITTGGSPIAQIKAVVADIDGTLTDMRRRISTDAVIAIRELPIPVILATGNVICFVRAASKLIGASDAMIGENGGVIQVGYDSKPFVLADIEECRRAAAMLKKYFPGMEQLDDRYRMSELAFRRTIDVGKARELVEKAYPGLEIVDTKFALHLKHKSVNKGTGLLKIASVMGLGPENFAALGDSENDLHMFKVAGMGLAVGNATPEVKAAVDYVAQKPYGEGAAEALYWLARRL
jgi:phosphoglycolate phosphatase (TIGR01487 family)